MKDDFAAWSKDYILFCHVTSRVTSWKHDGLLSEKGGNGFPYLVFMDADGNVIARHDGARDVSGFSESAGKAKEFLALKKKAAGGDKAAKAELFLAQLELGHLKADEARKRLKDAGLSKEQQEKAAGMIAGLEVQEVLSTVTRDKSTRIAAGKKFQEMKKAGKPAPTGDMEVQAYWILMMDAAEEAKDAAGFSEALEALKTRFGAQIPAAFTKASEDRLKKIKEK